MWFLIYILDVLVFVHIMAGGVAGAELLARWLEKKYDEHMKKEEEKKYGRK